jgi:hypothetical protein
VACGEGNAAPTDVAAVTSSGAGYVCKGVDPSVFSGSQDIKKGKPLQFVDTLGSVHASLTGTASSAGSPLSNAVLDVVYGHTTAFRGPVRNVVLSLMNNTTPQSWAPVCLAKFPGSSAPTVLVYLAGGSSATPGSTGVEAFRPSRPGGQWVHSAATSISGWSLRAVDHQVVLQSETPVYTFGPQGLDGFPVDLLQVRGDRFVDVTKKFLSVVAQDAKTQWKYYASSRGLGPLAAWVVDECAVGDQVAAFKTVSGLEARGELKAPPAYPTVPAGAAYVRYLHSVCGSVP